MRDATSMTREAMRCPVSIVEDGDVLAGEQGRSAVERLPSTAASFLLRRGIPSPFSASSRWLMFKSRPMMSVLILPAHHPP
jgi:hypothetical protein